MNVIYFTSAAILCNNLALFGSVCSTILYKYPFLFSNKVYGWSNSTIVPPSITIILSESITVIKRWAIVNTVHVRNLFLIVFCIKPSVLKIEKTHNLIKCFIKIFFGIKILFLYYFYCGSTLAVASSNTRILLFRTIALAKHTNCLWPTLKLDPPSDIFEFRPSDKSSTISLSST